MTDDTTNADQSVLAHPPGSRYTGNDEILSIEADLREQGETIDNPARPIEDHPELGVEPDTADEIRAAIEREADSADPNTDRIGRLNAKLNSVTED